MHFIKITLFILLAPVLAYTTAALAADTQSEISSKGSIAVENSKRKEIADLAKISIQDAIAIAKKMAAGAVIEAALEVEDGFLVYEVELVEKNRSRHEIYIDAGTGAVLKLKEKKQRSHDAEED